jgi:AcrR family transcriptional regulator
MPRPKQRADQRKVLKEKKRALILDAARKIFEAEGLQGASLRAIAAAAGYTPAALYFHFDCKEAIYAEVLRRSLSNLGEAIARATLARRAPHHRLRAAAMAFFRFYEENPRDLDLGFYLLRGGMKPQGLGRARNDMLNAALTAALSPIADAAETLGARHDEAKLLMVDTFAHAAGLLLLAHTGRLRTFAASAPLLMQRFLDGKIAALTAKQKDTGPGSGSPSLRGARSPTAIAQDPARGPQLGLGPEKKHARAGTRAANSSRSFKRRI